MSSVLETKQAEKPLSGSRLSPLAGKPAPREMLVDLAGLEKEYNGTRQVGLADGIVITPSHNPPEDGGFKYNPPNGGVYAESFKDESHLNMIIREAQEIVSNALGQS